MGSDKDKLALEHIPKEEPVLTMGGNYYYRLHLIMIDIDRAAINKALPQWYSALLQLYRNIKPLINERLDKNNKSYIQRTFKEIDNLLHDKRNYSTHPHQRSYFLAKHSAMAEDKLGEITSMVLAKMNQAKMLMPKVKKRNFDYFTESIVPNKRHYKITNPVEFGENERNY